MKTFAELRQHYLDQGFSSLGISTRTGAEILRNGDLRRVVKLTIAGKDPSVVFSDWVKAHPMENFPRVYNIHRGDSTGGQEALNWCPCAIEMEELVPLNAEEQDQYSHWIESYLSWRAGRSDRPGDPLGLLGALDAIFDQAEDLQGAISVSVRKSRGIMARDEGGQRTLVILDPWY